MSAALCTWPAALAGLAVAAAPAQAQDRWTGADKAQHFTYSAFSGLVAQAVVPNPWAAVALASTPGLLRELTNSTGFSTKDMVWNVIGASAGVAGGRFVALKSGGRVQVSYSWEY